MNLFENEEVSISRIWTVGVYEGIAGSKKSYDVALHSYELIYKLSGKNSVHFAKKDIVETADDLRFLPKGKNSGEYLVDIFESGECIDIYFDTDDKMPNDMLLLKDMSELRPLFTKLCKVWESKKTGYYSECMSIMYDIIKRIKLHRERYSSSEKASKILPSFEYMLEHYTEKDFDYEKMCEASKLSYSYFKELFIMQYGISPVKYVTNLRIERAKELLITGRYTITEIAEECGYDSIYYFSKVFKKYVGVAPKNYEYSDKQVPLH